MSPTSRRTFIYWLLLLLPTLVAGTGAIHLLRREQSRLAERSADADEARRAALAARARLIVENVELLVGDVQMGLLDVLAAEPAGTLESFLEQWERNNPLVRTAFLCAADGRVLRPDLRLADEEARGFLRRFAGQLQSSPPWTAPAPALPPAPSVSAEASPVEKRERQVEDEARREVASNVAQVQSARRDVQELLKARDYSYASSTGAEVAMAPSAPSAPSAASAASAGADDASSRAQPKAGRSAEGARSEADAAVRPSAPLADLDGRTTGKAAVAKIAADTTVSPGKDTTGGKRGWRPWVIDGRMHLLGWVQPAGGGDVRGVELELAALISRLGGTLPAEVRAGEGFALRDSQGRVLHQIGAVPLSGLAVARVPLAGALLPGWEVVAYLSLLPTEPGAGGALLWFGSVLVALFVAAILAGGALLLRQARRSEEEAAQKTSFVANVSHEFKTPLTTIRLYAELLEQGRVRDAAQGGDYLRTIGRETQRLARLVNNALDFSRLEQGRKKYAREEVDLTAEFARLLDTHAPRLAEAGLTLKRALPASPLVITTDRDALEQIVLNLLDNACKYAAEGGSVLVTVGPRDGGGAVVSVADRGPGVSPEHRARIFEKFHRVDDTLTSGKGGAGLGLTIARQLARGLGGELRHGPRAGGGAEFILELP